MPVAPNNPGLIADDRPNIVLIEDDAALSTALAFALDLEGFEVEVYKSAATVRAEDMPATGCLVIDYKLPGENGLSVLARLRAADVKLPAIITTSHADVFVRSRSAALFASIVEKPLLGETLVLAIRTALAGPAPT